MRQQLAPPSRHCRVAAQPIAPARLAPRRRTVSVSAAAEVSTAQDAQAWSGSDEFEGLGDRRVSWRTRGAAPALRAAPAPAPPPSPHQQHTHTHTHTHTNTNTNTHNAGRAAAAAAACDHPPARRAGAARPEQLERHGAHPGQQQLQPADGQGRGAGGDDARHGVWRRGRGGGGGACECV
jgi:hypothetical protein